LEVFEMKKMLTALVSISMMFVLVGSAQARNTKAPRTVSAKTRTAAIAKLESRLVKIGAGKRLSAKQLKALGLRPASAATSARMNRLRKHGVARAATVGSVYWYSYTYAGVVYVDRWYDGPFVSGSWDPYYVIYDNFRIGGNYADIFYYEYLLDYNNSGAWYWYGPNGYGGDNGPGFGPLYG
jgi:hypothetical protein